MDALEQGRKPRRSPAPMRWAAHALRSPLDLPHAPLPTDPAPGARVSVVSDDYGKDPVTGDLVSIGPDHVTLRRETRGGRRGARALPALGLSHHPGVKHTLSAAGTI